MYNVISLLCLVFNLTLLEILGVKFFCDSPDLNDHIRVQKNLKILKNLGPFKINPVLSHWASKEALW